MTHEVLPTELLRVLLVDDDTVDRMAVRRALLAGGLWTELTEAHDGVMALELLRRHAYDCVLLDFQMPGRDGAWVLERARSEALPTPIIMLTGQGDELTAVNLMKAGAADYVPKSALTAERLEQSLRHTVRVHRVELEAALATRLLAESQQRLQLALDITSQGTWDLNVLTGELELDARSRSLLGVTGQERVTLEAALAGLPLEDRGLQRERLVRAMDPESGGHYDLEHRVLGVPGARARWIRAIGRCFFENGRPVRMVGTLLDITKQRDEEEEQRKRLEFEQHLLGIVSHDLRNPVSAMMMNAAALLRREELSAQTVKSLARIVSSGERATRMIRDLLDFTQARIGGGIPVSRKPMNLHDIAAQTVEEVRASFPGRDIGLVCEGDGRGSWDADRLAQILTNLVVNAVAYSPATSTVTVRVGNTPDGSSLEVHNLGAPIPAEKQSELFEPFKRGTDPSQGHQRSIGLGLYIVREVVEAHDGSVEVRSTTEEGTLFRILLPGLRRSEAA